MHGFNLEMGRKPVAALQGLDKLMEPCQAMGGWSKKKH